MLSPQLTLGFHDELFLDGFAGGGGASTGAELAMGRPVDMAFNHNRKAVAMHRMNHPQTMHFCEDIRRVDIGRLVGDRRVAGIWTSPDCTHFSRARGSKPRLKKIRGLAWTLVHWVNVLRKRKAGSSRVLYLENVGEFVTWAPLLSDNKTVNPWRPGWTFRCFVGALYRRGYHDIEWAPGDGYIYRRTWDGIEQRPDLNFSSRACDHGAPTIRKRLFLVARCDGRPIIWPKETHAEACSHEVLNSVKKPYRTIAECLDFTLPCPSIFLSTLEAKKLKIKRPLVRATLARLAKGVDRYVLKAARPFIVELTHHGNDGVASVDTPIKTITAAHRGEKALCAPVLAQHGRAVIHGPVEVGKLRGVNVVASNMIKLRGDPKTHAPGSELAEPCHTISAQGQHHAVAAIHMTKFRTGAVGSAANEPSPTITANGYVKRPGGAIPVGVVAAYVAQHNGGANGHQTIGHPATAPASTISSKGSQQQLVATSLIKYYGTDQDPRIDEPSHTITSKHRFGLSEATIAVPPFTPELEAKARQVAQFLRKYGVEFEGEFAMVGDYVIIDIGMRMLKPRELYLAQGFPEGYIIDRGLDRDAKTGRLKEIRLTATEQIQMCGNSVCPVMATALIAANNPELCRDRAAA